MVNSINKKKPLSLIRSKEFILSQSQFKIGEISNLCLNVTSPMCNVVRVIFEYTHTNEILDYCDEYNRSEEEEYTPACSIITDINLQISCPKKCRSAERPIEKLRGDYQNLCRSLATLLELRGREQRWKEIPEFDL